MSRPTYYPAVAVSLSLVMQGDDAREFVFTTTPRTASWTLNSYMQADTCSFEVDASAFPFHPDEIRSMGFELHGFLRASVNDDLEPYLTPENLLVAGRAEDGEFTATDDGKWIAIEGSDYTTRLSGRPWDASRKVPVGERIDNVIQRLVDQATDAHRDKRGRVTSRLMRVRVELAQQESPGLRGGVANAVLFAAHAALDKQDPEWRIPVLQGYGSEKKGISFPDGKNYWDVITELCLRVGKRVFVRGLDVIISTPQDQIALADGESFIEDGTVNDSALRTKTRRLCWGKNLCSLAIKRTWAGEIVPQQIVRCFDPLTQKTLEGKWPPAVVAKRTKTGKEAPHVSIVHGTANESDLMKMARTKYHEIARGEMTVEVETRTLTDLDGQHMLQLRAGDPLWIEYEPVNRDALAELTPVERYARLVRAGFNDDVAQVVAARFDALSRWSRPYYVREASGEWAVEDGITIKAQAINYVRHYTADKLADTDDGTVDAEILGGGGGLGGG